MRDGWVMCLHKPGEGEDCDLQGWLAALNPMQRRGGAGQPLVGLLCVEPKAPVGHRGKPLSQLSERELCPGEQGLQNINASFR